MFLYIPLLQSNQTLNNILKLNIMETIKKFATKGKKYQIELIKDNYGYSVRTYKNGDRISTDNLGNCSLGKAILEVDSAVKNAKYFDNINYFQI